MVVFVNTKLFLIYSLIVKGQQNRIETVTMLGSSSLQIGQAVVASKRHNVSNSANNVAKGKYPLLLAKYSLFISHNLDKRGGNVSFVSEASMSTNMYSILCFDNMYL